MRAALDTLAEVLTDAVADAECADVEVIVTAGRPASPSDEGRECQTVIYVFGEGVTDLNQNNQDACVVRSRWSMQFEIWTCYPEDWYDPIATAEAEEAADCLYELMDLAWCGLVDAKDAKTFGDCDFVELSPLQVESRSGGAVSALGGLVSPCPCEDLTSP